MTFLTSWEDFEKAAERLYLQVYFASVWELANIVIFKAPMKCRYSTKYNHSMGVMEMKMTDDAVCLQVYNKQLK